MLVEAKCASVSTMSVQDVHDQDDIFVLSRLKIYMKRDFMNRCARLPLEIKYDILYRCPLGTVAFLKSNKHFWQKKREYDEQEYGKRAKLYWRPGKKRILWDPREKDFNLHECKRPKGEDMPIAFEISQFWTHLQLCHLTHRGGIVRPYRSDQWFQLILRIEQLTYDRLLQDANNETPHLADLPVTAEIPVNMGSSEDENEEESAAVLEHIS